MTPASSKFARERCRIPIQHYGHFKMWSNNYSTTLAKLNM